jgi:hypothetical protein
VPIIAYQSFNANSSKTAGLASISMQKFTKDTNLRVTKLNREALVLPYDTQDLATPIEGPPNKVPIEKLTKSSHTEEVFGSQIALNWQNFQRQYSEMPDIMVIGELNLSNPDFSNMVGTQGVVVKSFAAKKACQSFTAISQGPLASQIIYLKSGIGYVAYSVGGLVVVFVHVPNAIAKSKNETETFYYQVAHALNVKGNVIDVVIGDTNQGSFNFTASALNTALRTDAYKNAVDAPSVSPVDNFMVTEGGTNSVATKMFDIAVYRSDVVELKGSLAYVSQSSGGITVTDHCGLAVSVERKKSG